MFEEEIIIYIILLLIKKIQHIKKEKNVKQTIYEILKKINKNVMCKFRI